MTSYISQSDDEGDRTSDGFSDNDVDEHTTPSAASSRVAASQPTFSANTALDAYFLHASKVSRTSSNVFSQIIPPLSADEYASSIALSPYPSACPDFSASLASLHRRHFGRFIVELEEGFNLIFYGFGSKRNVLNEFATQSCRKRGHVVVVNGFQPSLTIKDVLLSIEKVPGLASLPLASNSADGQLRRISDFFSVSNRPLYLFIHNFDAPVFRSSKARACLSPLISNFHIHIVASIDHINAPLLWSSSDTLTRKQPSTKGGGRGHAWLWHDLTTLSSYDTELSFADRSSLRGATPSSMAARLQSAPTGDGGVNGAAMTETAAQHILASVTQKAQKLFAMVGNHQLDAMEEAGDASATQSEELAIAYDRVFNMARDNFIATNDTALRSLLGEFRDHGLVVITGASTLGGSELLWIPLRKERLARLLEWLKNH
ncbi:hypothetical protein EW146_g839 [Bondarzewia mesenterica]|uniref:Origin recognition complex subunit 2 n=1 Tax=Bondarzewia mesenterica TaxID=1095465 RepID=A0A4S4M683_9AGAM|nr:hypothetical protein EW146_g839 [Bondarzewia mesenterica]